jgi:uroporphyrinogen decarboxylase
MHYSTGISAFAYRNLRRYLDLPEKEIEIIDPTQFLARVDEDVLERFHCDCTLLHPGYQKTIDWNPREDYRFKIPQALNPVLMPDGSWFATDHSARAGLHMPKGGFFFDGNGYDMYAEDPDSVFERYAREAERIFKETDYFTIYIGFSGYHGDIDYMCDMVTDPDRVHEDNARTCERDIARIGRMIDRMGETIQGIAVGGDWGTQAGPFVDPALYEELCYPYLKKFCSFVHENSDYKIFNHSCGAVRAFIPYFIDAGIDILNPVQISAADMDPQTLKREFGDRITFWGGGCDTQRVLNFGSPADVAANVRELTSIFKPNSGFVFNQVHNIMGDTRPENIVAMLDTAWENSIV